MSKSILLLLLSFGLAGISSASSVYVSGSGQFSSSDVPGALVSPSGLFSFQFTVDTNPMPVAGTVSSLGFDAPFYGFQYRLNGVAVGGAPAEIRFNTLANGGLFDVSWGMGLNAAVLSFQGPQAFSGSTSSPVLTLGTYTVSSFIYSDQNNYDTEATRLSVSIIPTPEPSSMFLLLSGFSALAAFPIFQNRNRKVNHV